MILLDDSSHLCSINRLAEDMNLDCYLLEMEKPLVFKIWLGLAVVQGASGLHPRVYDHHDAGHEKIS